MPFTTTKMGLRVWNLLTDLYDHAQLADNWAKVDYHDHSPGRGVQIPGEGIANDSITSNHIQAGAISGTDLAPASVAGDRLADGSVSNPKLADGSVSSAKLDPAFVAQLGSIKLAELTPSSGTISFTGIPATYRHLKIIGSVRSGSATPGDLLRLRLNNASGVADYEWIYMQWDPSQVAWNNPFQDTSDSEIELGSISNNAISWLTDFEILIPNYRETAWQGVQAEMNASGATGVTIRTARGRWFNTAVINQIDISSVNGLGAPSRATLYGMA